jgi:hypothetical protein
LLAALESLEVLGYDITQFYFKQNNGRRRNAKAYIAIKRRKLSKSYFGSRMLPYPLSPNTPSQTDKIKII